MSRYAERVKAGIVGPPSSGKTHFLHAFLSPQKNNRQISPTLALQFYQRIISIGQRQVALRVWDTSGQEKYKPMVPYHLQQCQVIILMYDLTNATSLKESQNWIKHLQSHGLSLGDKKLLVIGNKLDLIRADSEQRQVRYQQIKQLLLSFELPITDMYEVSSNNPSAVDRAYIKQIFEQIITEVLQQRNEDEIFSMRVKLDKEGITVTQPDDAHQQNYCGECTIY